MYLVSYNYNEYFLEKSQKILKIIFSVHHHKAWKMLWKFSRSNLIIPFDLILEFNQMFSMEPGDHLVRI